MIELNDLLVAWKMYERLTYYEMLAEEREDYYEKHQIPASDWFYRKHADICDEWLKENHE